MMLVSVRRVPSQHHETPIGCSRLAKGGEGQGTKGEPECGGCVNTKAARGSLCGFKRRTYVTAGGQAASHGSYNGTSQCQNPRGGRQATIGLGTKAKAQKGGITGN